MITKSTSFDLLFLSLPSHQTPLLDARMELAHRNTMPSHPIPIHISGKGRDYRTGSVSEFENLYNPFIPNLPVVGLAIHGNNDLGILRDV